jgi:hypothetical protein
VRARYFSRPAGERKPRFPAPQENHPEADGPSPRSVPPCPAEKARQVDALRAALAGTAPAFEARLRRGGEAKQ